MNTSTEIRLLPLALLLAAAGTHAQNVDTSEWECAFCPFEYGYDSSYEVGATSVSDEAAYFGNQTGYDDSGVFPNLDGDGRYTTEGGYRMTWDLEDLGLDSRVVAIEGGHQGRYEYTLDYQEFPRREFYTTNSVFRQTASDTLSLPGGWVPAGTTGGMTELDTFDARRDITSDRAVFGLGGKFLFGGGFSVGADVRRIERDGVNIYGGSGFTNAALLPMPFDYATDEVDVTLRYGGERGFASVGWYLSDFENENTGLFWEHPFTSPAGVDAYALAQAPDSRFQQISVAGGFSMPAAKTSVSASAAFGEIEQDTPFLSYTTNTLLNPDPLPRANLDGSVDTLNYAFALTSRIIPRARFGVTWRYDERDNGTDQATWNRVITDFVVSNEFEMNIPYSFERSVLEVSGDYRLPWDLKVGAGYERRQVDRDFQEVAEQTEDTGWGSIRWRPGASFELRAKGGAARRDVELYDEAVAIAFDQNPLLRKYNLAYRYREFGELSADWSPGDWGATIGLSALYADDSYSRSELGLTSGEELLLSLDLGYAFSEKVSVYVNAGVDEIESTQLGSASFGAPDWSATNDDSFVTYGGGLRMIGIGEGVNLELDFIRSEGTSEIVVTDAGGPSQFPDLENTLDYVRLGLGFDTTENLSITADIHWQRFETSDWAIAGVDTDTIPTVLSLGAQDYDEDVLTFGVGFRYSLGSIRKATD